MAVRGREAVGTARTTEPGLQARSETVFLSRDQTWSR